MSNNLIPETGYVRLPQIIGQKAVTPEQAAANRAKAKQAKEAGQKMAVGPRTPRPAIPPLLPISKSAFWQGVKDGRYPKPVKLGPRTTVWLVSDIKALIERHDG